MKRLFLLLIFAGALAQTACQELGTNRESFYNELTPQTGEKTWVRTYDKNPETGEQTPVVKEVK